MAATDKELRELTNNLKDRTWRLNNLYYIKNKKGKRTLFKMTKEQREYYENEHTRNIILKARQLGFTTLVCIMQLDAALFEGLNCAMIAHTLHDAKRLFREKIQYAYNNLPDSLKVGNISDVTNANEITFAMGGSVTVSTSFRGGTVQRLHVSEFGKICAKFPEKAEEIVSGAAEACDETAIITYESTAEGRSGRFYDYCMEAKNLVGKELGAFDLKFFFFNWYDNPLYATTPTRQLPSELEDYFAKLELEIGFKLTDSQKAWYAAKQKLLKDKIYREYPSTPDEAFKVALEGAVYASQFAKIYTEKRIVKNLASLNTHLPVLTYWDIGHNDATAIWFVRKVGDEYHVIDYYEISQETIETFIRAVKSKDYEYAGHYLPHDSQNVKAENIGAKSFRRLVSEGFYDKGEFLQLKNVSVVPKSGVEAGINQVRAILDKCYFDEDNCRAGILALESYQRVWDEDKRTWGEPIHDWSSHAADGFRYFAVSQLAVKPAKNTRENRKKVHMQ